MSLFTEEELLSFGQSAPVEPIGYRLSQYSEPVDTQDEGSLTWGDHGRSIMMGGASVAEGAGYIAKKLGFEDSGQFIQDLGSRAVEFWAEGLSDHAKQEMAKQFIQRNEIGEYELGDASWDTVKLSIGQSALGTMAGMGVGGAFTKGLTLVPKLPKVAAGMLGYGAGEALVASGSSGANVEKQVQGMTHEQLMEHPEYQAAFAELGDEQAAKDLIVDAASEDAAALTALSTFFLSAPFGGLMGKVFSGAPLATTRARSIASGAAGEAGQEFLQSGAEALSQNYALKEHADPNQDMMHDVLNNAVGGAAAGGVMGGAFGMASPLDKVAAKQREAEEQGGDALDQAVAGASGLQDAVQTIKPTLKERAAGQVAVNQFAEQRSWQRKIDELASNPLMPGQSQPNFEYDARSLQDIMNDVKSTPEFIQRQAAKMQEELDRETLAKNTVDYEPVQVEQTSDLSLLPKEQEGIPYTGGQLGDKTNQLAANIEKQIASSAKQERVSSLPENLQDERLTKPAYRESLEAFANSESTKGVNPRGPIDTKTDDLLTAIAKNGGINRVELEQDGFDIADMKGKRVGIRPVFREKGKSVDDMAEALVQDGYIKERNVDELKEKIRTALSGEAVMSQSAALDQMLNETSEEYYQGNDTVALRDGSFDESPQVVRQAINKALSGQKLGDRESRIVTSALDMVQGGRSEKIPQALEQRQAASQRRVARKALRVAVLDNADIARDHFNTQKDIPEPDYQEIDNSEFDESLNLAEDERVVVEALLDADSAGIPAAVTNELANRHFDDNKALASAIYSLIRKQAANGQRQGNTDEQATTATKTETATSDPQGSGETAGEAESGNAESDEAQVGGSGQGRVEWKAKQQPPGRMPGNINTEYSLPKQEEKAGSKEDATVTDYGTKNENPLYIEDISEKAFVVLGDTKTHKDKIKALGGRWNRKRGGWVFPKARLTHVTNGLGDLLKSDQANDNLVTNSDQATPESDQASDAIQDYIDGTRNDPPTYGEVEQEQKTKTKIDQVADSIDSEIDAVAAELADLLKSQLGSVNSGVDPKILALGAKLGALYVSKGVVKFAQYSQAILTKLKEMGVDPDQVKPMLKEFYGATQAQVSDELFDQMDDMRTVRKFDLDGLVIGDTASGVTSSQPQESFDDYIYNNLQDITDNRKLKSLVAAYEGKKAADITDAQMKSAQEAVELALVKQAREVVAEGKSDEATYNKLVELYKNQPNLNVRSSTSMENQAYSTPAPIAFLASRMAGINKDSAVYEPTAGNGMLLVGANPETSVANELEDLRVSQLKALGFNVTQNDAVENNPGKESYDAVIMNPPFGSLSSFGHPKVVKQDGYSIKKIDHLIAAKALEAMKDDGKATIIIGASKQAGEISPGDKIFFNWLYSHYNVVDHVEIDGDLYKRQGAGWPIRVITVSGRQQNKQLGPVSGAIERLETWEQIYDHFEEGLDSSRRFVGNGEVHSGSGGGFNADNDSGNLPFVSDGEIRTPNQSGEKGGKSGSKPGNSTGLGGGTNVQRPPKSTSASNSNQGQPTNSNEPSRPDTKGQDDTSGSSGNQGTGVSQSSKPSSERDQRDSVSKSDYQSSYNARSGGFNEAVLTPNNMAEPLENALVDLESAVGDIDTYVMDKLGYSSKEELHKAFMGLQVDAVAAAIFNIENKNKGIVIADQTGVGKGRQAAAIIRYAIRQGKVPVFLTEKKNLYTDMYDDLADIGSNNVRPLITDASEGITKGSKKLFKNPGSKQQKAVLQEVANSGQLPEDRNAIFSTYSQINQPNVQREVLSALGDNAIFVLDESHNVAGDQTTLKKDPMGNGWIEQPTTAGFVNGLIEDKPVVYLSATFAKRPDNMPIYYRTSLMDAVDNVKDLVEAVARGGTPLQTIISRLMARAGQLFRRERSFEGISVPVVIDTKNAKKHEQISDKVTGGIRAVLDADNAFNNIFFKEYRDYLQKLGQNALPAGSKPSQTLDTNNFNAIVHNFISQLQLALKVDEAATKAIEAYKQGKKPVIGLANTMESFLNEFVDSNGLSVGDKVDADYRDVLLRALERTRRVTVQDEAGNKYPFDIPMDILDPTTKQAYLDAQETIMKLDIGEFPISPIDHMRKRIEAAGLKVAEITGRDTIIDYSGSEPVVAKRKKWEKNKRTVVDRFNRGEVDVVIINSAGSTGLSIHASEKFKDQKPRHMIIAQTPGDVNTLVQMLGRINRTGQVALPTYELMGLDLPSEKRPLAVAQAKLASLNANTSANEESDTSLDVANMFNKYGDQVATQFLMENPDIAEKLDMSVGSDSDGDAAATPGTALKMTGRMARLPVKEQQRIYDQIEPVYNDMMDYLTRTNQNDLVTNTLDTDAKILSSEIVYEGKAPGTLFGGNTTMHYVDMKYQGKPPRPEEVEKAVSKSTKEKSADQIASNIVEFAKQEAQAYYSKEEARIAKLQKELGQAQLATQKERSDPDDSQAAKRRLKQLEEKENKIRKTLSNAENNLEKAKEIESSALSALSSYKVGHSVKLEVDNETVNAVVTSIDYTHKKGKGFAFAPSKLRFTFMVNSGVRQLTLPITKIAGLAKSSVSREPVSNYSALFTFDPDNNNLRERRYIATGNLIAGSADLKGRIVLFTDDKGKTHEGILMPKNYKKSDEDNVERNFAVRDKKVAVKFLQDNKDRIEFAGGLFASNQKVRLSRNDRGWYIQVPKSKTDSTGNSVKFDKELRKIMASDFFGSGKTMQAQFDDSKLAKVIDRLMDITPLYALPSMRDAWVKAGGSEKEEATNSFDDSGVRFSINAKLSDSANGAPVSKMEADKVIRRVTRKWKSGSDDVVLLDSFDDLPSMIVRQAEEYEADKKKVKGVFHFGKIYLVRENLHSIRDLEETLFHEGYGHYGLRQLMGKEVNRELNRLFMAIGGLKGFNEIARKNRVDLSDYAKGVSSMPRHMRVQVMMDELLAHIAESNKPGIKRAFKELMGKIRQWLRKMGFVKTSELNSNELLLVLRNARLAMEGKNTKVYSDSNEVRFNVGGENGGSKSGRGQRQASEEFGRNLEGESKTDWHLQTRIRSKNGRPLKVFRGGRSGIEAENFSPNQLGKATNHPSAALGVWFTTSNSDANRYGDHVDSVYLDIRKPKVYKTDNVPSFDSKEDAVRFAAKLKAQGHDGVVFDYRDIGGPLHIMAFKADQVYKPDSGNTLFSLGSSRTDEKLEKFGLGPKKKAKLSEFISGQVAQENEDSFWSLFKHRAYEGMFNGLIGIKRAEDAAGVSDVKNSGYIGARMATGIADVMHGILHYGAPKWKGGALQYKEGTQGLLDILGKAGADLHDFLAWVGAHRAEELMAQGREQNLTQEDIDDLKSRAKGKEALFKEIHREYKKLNDAMLDMAEEAGLVNPESRKEWQSDWYIPFYRNVENEAGDLTLLAPRTKRGLSHQTSGIKQLKGGAMATNDLLENILANWMKLADASMKNSALVKTVDNLSGTDYIEEFDGESEVDYVGKKSDKNVIRIQREGRSEYYKVHDPALLRAVTHLSSTGHQDPVSKAGRYMKRLLTTGVTASPDFILRNFIRDAAHAWAINPDGFKFATDSLKGFKDALREDPAYRELMFAGASFQGGYVHGTDPEASAQIIRRALEKKGLSPKAIHAYEKSLLDTPAKGYDALKRGWQKYREFGDKIENANRLATYKAARANGKELLQAAFEAKDLMDYSLRGNFQLMQYMIDLVPFMNARLQGMSKLARAARENPKRVIVQAGVKLAFFSFALAMLNDDDERYQKLPDWDKDANWHFWLGDEHYRIPKPFEIGIVFGTLPERLYHTAVGNQESEKLLWSLSHNLWETMAINPTPQFAMPMIESVANRQFFFDKPIEGMSDQGKLPEARYDENTSMTMRIVGDWLGMSPKKLQHLWNGYLGTMGMYALGAADMAANWATDRPDRPAKGLEDLPVMKVLYRGDGPAKSTQYTTDVYDYWSEVEEIYRTIRAFQKEGKTEEANDLMQSNRDKLKYRRALGKARKQLGDIRDQMNRVSRNRLMDADRKKERMDKLIEQRNAISKRFAELAEEAF